MVMQKILTILKYGFVTFILTLGLPLFLIMLLTLIGIFTAGYGMPKDLFEKLGNLILSPYSIVAFISIVGPLLVYKETKNYFLKNSRFQKNVGIYFGLGFTIPTLVIVSIYMGAYIYFGSFHWINLLILIVPIIVSLYAGRKAEKDYLLQNK